MYAHARLWDGKKKNWNQSISANTYLTIRRTTILCAAAAAATKPNLFDHICWNDFFVCVKCRNFWFASRAILIFGKINLKNHDCPVLLLCSSFSPKWLLAALKNPVFTINFRHKSEAGGTNVCDKNGKLIIPICVSINLTEKNQYGIYHILSWLISTVI